MSQVAESLERINGSPEITCNTTVGRALGRLRSELEYTTMEEIMEIGLHQFLDNLQQRMNQVGKKIFEAFFALQPVS